MTNKPDYILKDTYDLIHAVMQGMNVQGQCTTKKRWSTLTHKHSGLIGNLTKVFDSEYLPGKWYIAGCGFELFRIHPEDAHMMEPRDKDMMVVYDWGIKRNELYEWCKNCKEWKNTTRITSPVPHAVLMDPDRFEIDIWTRNDIPMPKIKGV